MGKATTSRNLALGAAGAALLAACATVSTGAQSWNVPPAGSTWQIAQRNTGSYGKDVTFQMTRGDAVWEGKQVVTLTNSNGSKIIALPDGRWMAMLGPSGMPFMTAEPPIGYLYPLSVGQSWSTRHKVTVAGKPTDVTYSCKVEAREQVTVPAGTFDTLKIVCQDAVSRSVSWTIIDHGVHAKQEFERFANHPQGAGTQQTTLMALNRRP